MRGHSESKGPHRQNRMTLTDYIRYAIHVAVGTLVMFVLLRTVGNFPGLVWMSLGFGFCAGSVAFFELRKRPRPPQIPDAGGFFVDEGISAGDKRNWTSFGSWQVRLVALVVIGFLVFVVVKYLLLIEPH